MEDKNRKAEWSFKLSNNIGAFEQMMHEEFPFDDALYYIAWQKQDERFIQGDSTDTKETSINTQENYWCT